MQAHIREITRDDKYEQYLYRCLAPMPYRKYSRRQELQGETFCLAHPLYRPQMWKGNVFEAK